MNDLTVTIAGVPVEVRYWDGDSDIYLGLKGPECGTIVWMSPYQTRALIDALQMALERVP